MPLSEEYMAKVNFASDKATATFQEIKGFNKTIKNKVEREAKIKQAKDKWWSEVKHVFN